MGPGAGDRERSLGEVLHGFRLLSGHSSMQNLVEWPLYASGAGSNRIPPRQTYPGYLVLDYLSSSTPSQTGAPE